MTTHRSMLAAFGFSLLSVAMASAQEPARTVGPVSAVEAFHEALTKGDREQALAWLDPSVVIFESGGAERSRDEYASHHLPSDIEFARSVRTEVLNRQTGLWGDNAWVLSRTRTTGTFRDRDLDSQDVETMVLRRIDGRWLIVHIHWSSRPSAPR